MSIVRFIADLHLSHANMATRRGFSTLRNTTSTLLHNGIV
jgi:calcineurin-like phosphoesterase family protein